MSLGFNIPSLIVSLAVIAFILAVIKTYKLSKPSHSETDKISKNRGVKMNELFKKLEGKAGMLWDKRGGVRLLSAYCTYEIEWGLYNDSRDTFINPRWRTPNDGNVRTLDETLQEALSALEEYERRFSEGTQREMKGIRWETLSSKTRDRT